MTDQNDKPEDPGDTPPSGPDRLRHPAPGVIDQRQQQIDPAGRHRVDRDWRPDTNRKQPGGSGPPPHKD